MFALLLYFQFYLNQKLFQYYTVFIRNHAKAHHRTKLNLTILLKYYNLG